jgi:serine/threonine protein phosphatase PrpC
MKNKKRSRTNGNNTMIKKTNNLKFGNLHNIGKRESQQDSFGISDLSNHKLFDEKGVLAVVADGMGGLSGGAEISAIVTSGMINYFSKANEKDLAELLLNMIHAINIEVRKYIINNGNQLSGSTVVSTIIKDNNLYFLTVGDSRIYLLRSGALIQLNREHTYGSELDENAARGDISVDDARNDSQRAALTSYIGMEDIAHIDRCLRPIPLISGDRILLMSDGIFGTLSEEEITKIATSNAYEAALGMEQLILAKNKNNQDNFTSIIIEIE